MEREVDLIGNEHEVPGGELAVDPSRGVCHDERSRAQLSGDHNGEEDHGQIVALVQVYPPLECNQIPAGEARRHDLALMTLDSRPGIGGNPARREYEPVGEGLRKVAKPGPEHERDVGGSRES